MRVILDTPTLLWFVLGRFDLSARAREIIEDAGTIRLLSAASLWEIAVKASLNRIYLAQPYEQLIPRLLVLNGIDVLPVAFNHIATVSTLPPHHQDVFDRLIVAQCLAEKLPIISPETALDAYGVERVW